ncbi:MAG: chitobiase/beta-hexosaminidase C-terminal domain-containing protein, partial [Myxococcales bacterium]|nr:chitobiase/beta-hexosaminidase C-terminal domain-containing protein [Myxococcales bacterium]
EWGTIEPDPPLAQGRAPALPAPLVSAPQASFTEVLRVELSAPGEPVIRHALDGGDPGPASPVYAGPIELRETTTLRAAVFDGERRGPVVVATFYRRTPGVIARLARPPHRSYQAGGAAGLTDGRRGTERWQTGGWLGYQGVDFEATLELASPRTVRRVGVGFLQDARAWIWMPRELRVEVSRDGERWRTLGRATHDVPDTDVDHTYVRELSVRGRAAGIRFVRVRAPTYGTIPAWHPGAGAPTFVFVDEVVVE